MSNQPPFNFQQYHLVYYWFYGSLILFRQSHRLSMYFVLATYFQLPCHLSVTFVSPTCHFYISAVFQPQFSTEIGSKSVSPPAEQELDTVEQFLEVLFLQLWK